MKSIKARLDLLDQPASQTSWDDICAALDACDDTAELSDFVALAQQKLKDWPTEIRLMPTHWADDAARKPLAKVLLVLGIDDVLAEMNVAFPLSFRVQSFSVEPKTDRILIGGSDSRFLYAFLFERGSSPPICLGKSEIKGAGAYANRVERVAFLPGRGDALAVMNAEGSVHPFKASIKIWRGARCVRHLRDAVGVRAPGSWHSAMVLPDADTSRLFVWLGGEKRLLIFHLGTYRLLKSITLPPIFSLSDAGSGKLLLGLERASFGILDVDSEKLTMLPHTYRNLNLPNCAASFSIDRRQFCSIHPFDPDRYDVQDVFLDGFGGVYWWEEGPNGAWEVKRKILFDTDILPEEVLAVYALYPSSASVDAFVLNNFAGHNIAQLGMWIGTEHHTFNFIRNDRHSMHVDPLTSHVFVCDGRRILQLIHTATST